MVFKFSGSRVAAVVIVLCFGVRLILSKDFIDITKIRIYIFINSKKLIINSLLYRFDFSHFLSR